MVTIILHISYDGPFISTFLSVSFNMTWYNDMLMCENKNEQRTYVLNVNS